MSEHKQSNIGFLTVLVGATGTGKSSIAKEMFEDAPAGCVFDIQEEYGVQGLHEFKQSVKPTKFSIHPAYYDREKFVRVVELTKGYTFALEESTGYIDNDFFKSKLGKRLIQCIVAKRHIQKESGGGNNYILVFHSVKSIPAQLWTFIDFMFLFPTVEKDFDSSDKLVMEAHSALDINKKIPFKNYEISDYRLIVRTLHGKSNLNYVNKYVSKRI
jgi:hypothetical protein